MGLIEAGLGVLGGTLADSMERIFLLRNQYRKKLS